MRLSFHVILWLTCTAVALGDNPQKPQTSPFGKRCGFLCMATVSGALGEPLRYQELAQRLPDSDTGSSLDELSQASAAIGLRSVSVRYPGAFPDLVPGEACAILPIRGRTGEDHFVVVVNSSQGVFSVVDFPNGMMRLTDQSLRNDYAWDGTALLIAKSSQQLDRLSRPPSRFWLWTTGSGLCFAVVLLSLLFRKRASHAT